MAELSAVNRLVVGSNPTTPSKGALPPSRKNTANTDLIVKLPPASSDDMWLADSGI